MVDLENENRIVISRLASRVDKFPLAISIEPLMNEVKWPKWAVFVHLGRG